MKKTLSFILAAIMCAAMTPAVMAEEAEIMLISEEPVAIEEVAAEEGIMAISEEEGQVVEAVAVDVEAIVALAASYNIPLTADMVNAILASGIEINAETLKLAAMAYGIVLPDEAITAILALLAPVPAVEEVVAEEVAAEEAVAEEAVVEEAVVEEEAAIEEEVVVDKYPVVIEEIPTFGLFTYPILSNFIFRG